MRVIHCESGAYVYNELITTWYSSIAASLDIEDIDSQTKLYI